MASENENDIYQLINSKDPNYQTTCPSVYHYIGLTLVDSEKISNIRSILNHSQYWQHDLALWCLIDNCYEQITALDITKLQDELNNTSGIQDNYSSVDVMERLIVLQSLNSYPCHIRNLIEVCIYLQTGPDAVRMLAIIYEDQSTSFEEFLNTLKILWIKKFLPELINSAAMETVQKNLHHKKHFLQCNIQIVQQFITSIPQPYELSSILKLFDYFTNEKNFLSLGTLESFLSEKTGMTLDICLNHLCVLICVKYMRNKIGPTFIPPRILSNLNYCIGKMLSSWSFNDLCDLMATVQNKDDIKYLNSVLTIIVEFDLVFDRTVFNFINRPESLSEWPQIIHSYAIQMSFSRESRMLELNDLLDTIINLTYTQLNAADKATKRQQLFNQYGHLSTAFNQFSSMNTKELQIRLKSIRRFDFYSLVSFVIRISDIIFQNSMRCVQKLSILLALDSSNTSARILQIDTGEGKTRLISVLAVIKSLQGVKVDVITSSNELAKIQSEELRSFYEFFNLKIACNADLSLRDYRYGYQRKNGYLRQKIIKIHGAFQPVYECDVIYGSADNFERDILLDEFNETGLRCDRQCEFALIDEVDSMMIDGRQQTLRLSTSVPSVFYLLPIKAFIWNQILNIAQIVTKKDGQWYKLCRDESENTVEELINESIEDFAKQIILPLLQRYVHLEDVAPQRSTEKLIIPKHLHKLTSAKLSRWIQNAAYANFAMKEGYEYILKNNKIIYVDAENTGILNERMRWSDGLHCFLEMKHGCSLEPEHITTNFISHVTFFRRYSTNVIGLTGTVGGEAAQRVFREIYSANCIIIPPFRKRHHYELRPYFISKKTDWFQYITDSCKEKMKQNRAVLIITKFIEEAQTIANLLRVDFPTKVKLYTESEEKNAIRDTLVAGHAIIATNIAGRGTDILVSEEAERNGGLHVCITFLPDNDRVERQNQGRTSRCGHKGTSQFIINIIEESNADYDEREKLEEMRCFRDTTQLVQMNRAIEEVKRTFKKDQIFQEFSGLQKIIIQHFPYHVQDVAKNALREKFGLWLIENHSKTDQELQQSFDQFKATCQNDPKNTLIDNPIYYVQMANTLLKNQENLDEAIDYLNTAIQMDPYCSASAFYSRAYARALKYKKSGDISQLENSISNFEEARRIIKEILDPTILLFPVASDKSPLHEFLVHLKNLYGMLVNSINVAIGRPVDEDIENLERQLQNNEMDNEQRRELEEILNTLRNNRSQIENGVLRAVLNSKLDIKIQRKTLMESLPSNENKNLYKKEIEEFERNGFIGIIIFNERKPIEWWSVISVGFIGLGQVLTGISLAVFSVGAGIGLGLSLLQEGISDLITCVKDGIINRNFSWIQWGIQKALSLAVTLASAGLSALKAAARTATSAVTTVKNAVNYGVKELWTKTLQEGIQIGGKKFALEGIKRVAIEVALPLADYALSETILPIIQTAIQTTLDKLIQLKFRHHRNLHRLMACDGKQRNRFYANQLKDNIISQLNEETFKNACLSVGTNLLKRTSVPFGQIATKLASITHILAPIINKVRILVDLIDTEMNRLGQSIEVENILAQANDQQHRWSTDLNYRDSNNKQAENKQLSLTVEEFCSDITEQMSKIICQYLQGVLIPPLIHSGIDQILSGFNQSVNSQLDLFHKKRTVLDHQILQRTEIYDNVNTTTLAAAQTEIDNIRQGAVGEIHHIGYISQAINRRIMIYDEQGRVEHVIGLDTSQLAIEIVFHPSNKPNGTGHWTIPNEENMQEARTYNCLFGIIGTQTDRDSAQLRQEAVKAMEGNRSKLAAAMHDLGLIRKNYRNNLFSVRKTDQSA